MARKNPKIFRQNGDGPDQKGLRSPACGAELSRFKVDNAGSQGDHLTPTRCTRPQGRVRIETSCRPAWGSERPCCTRPQGRVRIETAIPLAPRMGQPSLHSPSGAGED